MANKKTGFMFWSVETDRYQDMKIKKLKKEFKAAGVAIYDYITNEIYRDKGCYIEWDESTAFDVAEYWDIKEGHLNEIVNYCCYVGLFNKELLVNESIISSKAHLNRWIDWSMKAKRADYVIPKKLNILLEESNILPEESAKVPEECGQTSSSLPRSNITEHKVKEITQNISPDGKPPDKKKVDNLLQEKNEYWAKFVSVFENFYLERKHGNYEYLKKDFGCLDLIYKFLKKRCVQKKLDWTEAYMVNSFSYFLKQAWEKDNWLEKNFSIPNILSQFNQIANGTDKKDLNGGISNGGQLAGTTVIGPNKTFNTVL